ncbi:ribose-phosphate diphosphokinase [Caulobacter sp. 602-1]|uniref:ribose-phosphate diphosphokinase n=1 Tax=Caulobacter sp. 602-1 TaxID=2492472 RepID=UPI000F6389E9|nr:ribose-phosphate diphosphokinase [Caulobacter sp. 602-1]RRN63821.1 ribose-phosphate diphosphokinase [Caulobacter sp. 602-1]
MRLLLPLPDNEGFAERLARVGGGIVGALRTRQFVDGESYVRIEADVAGRVVDLVCTLARPDAAFLRLAFAADALRDLGATQVNLIAPYLGYLRQDTRFLPGEAVTSRTFARLLGGVVDRIVTVDPHLHRYADLESLYAIPCRTLHAAPLLAAWIRARVPAPLIVGPDIESRQWVAAVAQRVGAPYVVLAKQRLGDREVRVELPDLAVHRGRRAVLIDDIAASGRTLAAAAEALKLQGFTPPVCVVVHAVFGEDALTRLQAVTELIVSTDSIEHPTNAIALAELFVDA